MKRSICILACTLLIASVPSDVSAQKRPIRKNPPPQKNQPPKKDPAPTNETPIELSAELPPFAEVRLGDNAFRAFGHRMLYSRDAALLAIANHERVVVLDAATGLTKQTFVHVTKTSAQAAPSAQVVVDMAFFADGKRLLTAETSGAVRIWSIEEGGETMFPTLHPNVVGLCLAMDEQHFFTCGLDGVVRRWSVGDTKEMNRWEDPAKMALVAVSAREGKVFTVNSEGVFYEWDPHTGQQTRKFDLGGIRFDGVRSDLAAMKLSDTGRAYGDLQTAKRNVIFSPDGAWLLQQQGNQMWDTATGKVVFRLKPDTHPASVAFSPDNQFVAIAANHAATVYGLASGLPLREVAGLPKFALALTPGASTISSVRPTQVLRWKVATLENEAGSAGLGEVIDWDISSDARRLVFSTRDRGVRFYDAVKGAPIGDLPRTISGDVVKFHPDGRTLVVGASGLNKECGIFHYRPDRTDWVRDKAVGGKFNFTRGRYLPVLGIATQNPILSYYDAFTGEEIRLQRNIYEPRPSNVSFSGDGKFLVAEVDVRAKSGQGNFSRFGGERQFQVLSLPDLKLVRAMPVGKHGRGSWIFSPDGRVMIQLAETLRVVELRTGNERGTLKIPSTCQLEFAPDGRSLLGGSADGRVVVSDLLTGAELFRTGPAHGGGVREIRTTPAGKIVSVGEDHTFVVWSDDVWRKRPSVKNAKLAPEDFDLFYDLLKQSNATNIGPTLNTLISGRDDTVKLLDDKLKGKITSATAPVNPSAWTPETVQLHRCIEILEFIANAEARKVLRRLSAGQPDAVATREARQALDRLARVP